MKRNEVTKKNRKKLVALALMALLLIGAGLTAAYFTDNSQVTNTFTFGSGVDTELTEPKWDSEGKLKAQAVSPNMTIVKDPTITNKGDDSFNFISIKIPHGKFAAMGTFGKKSLSEEPLIDATGACLGFDPNATGAVDTTAKDLFEFTINGENWRPIEVNLDPAGNYQEYIFAYVGLDNNLLPLKKGEKTTPLFLNDQVRVINLVNDTWATEHNCTPVSNQTFNLPVEVYSIQTSDIINSGSTSSKNPVEVWAVVKAQVETLK